MKKYNYLILVFLAITFFASSQTQSEYNAVGQNFAQPIVTAKPTSFWWWLNSIADKPSITRDLEEFKAKGMGGVTLICSSNWPQNENVIPENGPLFLSAEWLELFKHTIKEAARLRLEVGVNFCASGWTMGGPWITPEMNGRWFVQSEMQLKGPQRLNGKLPLPDPRGGYKAPYQFNVKLQMQWPKEKMDYRDNAVVAIREKSGQNNRFAADLEQLLDAKSNRKDADCHISPANLMEPTIKFIKNRADDQPVKLGDIIDLTSKLKADGSIDWQVPEGEWTIIRTGHVATGAPLVCILPEFTEGALAVDWLNAASVDTMYKYLGKVLIDAAGKEHVGKTFKYFHTDSYEDGYPNWTDKILKKFKTYRGYDPTPYLPVFTGRIIGSAEISDRFLYDYRKTAADLFADESLKRLTEISNKHGMLSESESAGPSWSGTVCIDALKNLGRVDRPMGEFWNGLAFIDHNDQNYVCKQTASAAHIYGKRIATTESFTNTSHWVEYPEILKPLADRAFCEGINRISFHTQTLQRISDGKPGYEYGAGTHFSPNVTWWNQTAGSWIDYLSRCSSVLQSGLFVGDVLFYNGDWAPNVVPGKHVNPSLGKGYDYDVCNAEVLLTRLSVKDGRIVLPDGMSYHVLVLPDKDFMPVEVIKKIKELVTAGATVIGPRPVRDPGLRNYPQCDKQIKKLAAQLWGGIDGEKIKENRFGKGKIVFGKTIREVLLSKGILPDFEIETENLKLFPNYPYVVSEEIKPGNFTVTEKTYYMATDVNVSYDKKSTFIDFIHRTTPEAEVYFLANRKNKAECINAIFRVAGRKPELWNLTTGEKILLPEYKVIEERTHIPMRFNAYDSWLVVFPVVNSADAKKVYANFSEPKTIAKVGGSWLVKFDKEWLYPKEELSNDVKNGMFEFSELVDWSKHPLRAIKYYSGTAEYTKTFQFSNEAKNGEKLYIDLGDVSVSARIVLNGNDLGVVWRKPFRVEISDAIKVGKNELKVEVVNLWPNRLIGDENLPENERQSFTNMRVHKATSALFPSGLLGPVTIQK